MWTSDNQPEHRGTHADVNATRRANASLAMSIRDGLHPDELRDFWISVWRDSSLPMELRMRAADKLAERGWGMPAQHVVVDASVKQEMLARLPPPTRTTRSLDEVNERRAQLRALGIEPKKVIDVLSSGE